MQNFSHPGIHLDELLAGYHQREFGWTHDPPTVHLGIGLGGAEAGLGHF